MKHQKILDQYISICSSNLLENSKILSMLKKQGIYERFIFENIRIGYSNGKVLDLVGDNEELLTNFQKIGILKNKQERFKNYITIPVLDENKGIVNIVGYNIHPQTKNRTLLLNEEGIFNCSFLKNTTELIFTENPLAALLLIQNDLPNTTFIVGDDTKYIKFITENNYRKVVFSYEGSAKLFYDLTTNGISTKRVSIDFEMLKNGNAGEYLRSVFSNDDDSTKQTLASDAITEIENGFIFKFPHINYRLIGNFTEYNIKLLANIKTYKGEDVFLDRIDLYKNRDRQSFIYNILDKFNIRDNIQIENDLNLIINVIEKHREKKQGEKKKVSPVLTDNQKEIGSKLLTNPKMLEEITEDYTQLGYVQEYKNKILLYLIMTSRLMQSPLHAIIISRSGAGKSVLAEITELLCPPEEMESISDLSPQALYYYENLKHKFIVIGEKSGSEGSDYPLRELISKKSITKAIPMKDPVTRQIKTVSVRVEGPISLVETSTAMKELDHENLNRCFIIAIDESEKQTSLIHQAQRKNHTLNGFLNKRTIDKIINKHIYAQRLLEKVKVFNPFAELLSFPTSKLKTRRDNEKFLRLINVICFLHQFQRKRKTMKIENEQIEYIECTVNDYKIAYDLLSDGVLDNTLDDLPRQARKLLEHIKEYLKKNSKSDNIPIVKKIFERKEIREYTSWSFAQIRNNFRVLQDYEYIQLIKGKNGMANQYRLSAEYSDLDFLNTIVSPKELAKKIKKSIKIT